MNRVNPALRLLASAGDSGDDGESAGVVESYRRLADVFHDILAEQSLDALLERIADTLSELIPHDTLTVFEADEARGVLTPVLARDQWADEILQTPIKIGEGITGWATQHREAVLVHQAHLDPRVMFVPGTPPDEPEALISVPLIARSSIKGALNIYRLGEDASFSEADFELAKRFGDAAALALDNAHIRARLEHQAQTDSLTGLYNHRYFHERLRTELRLASRTHEPVAVLMLDLDDFKRVNDIYGHGTGDEVLRTLADLLRSTVRTGDVVCRLGGEEFGIIVPACGEDSALQLGRRVIDAVEGMVTEPAGAVTVSVGLAQGPRHAMNPRELVGCAEAAMMTAKARGKNQLVAFGDGGLERPAGDAAAPRDGRSIAHLKMLQSLSGKLNRLNDVREIGLVIANELRSLIDYHNCRVFVVEGEDVLPIAFQGEFVSATQTGMEVLATKVGWGITGRVAETGEPLLVPDAARHENARLVPGTDEIEESQVLVPMRYGPRVIGIICISKLGIGQFDDDDVRLLEVLAGQAAVALENARLYDAQRREAESAKALLEFSRELAASEGLDEVLARIVELTAAILGSPSASVRLEDLETGELVARAAFGDEDDDSMPTGAEYLRASLERAEPFVVTRPSARDGGLDDGYIVAPLVVEGGRAGCIVAALPPGQEDASERERELLAGIAYQAKLAITNAGTIESLEGTFFSTVEALANALEANDEYTSSHARWITDMALRVGEALGLDAPALKRLELGALFHDIGKIGIPSTILLKPGRLTAEERTVIETHPELGERIIAPIQRLQAVRPIVRHCHEHFDGSGYPDGKNGDEIPLEARIILVCDAFHAMTTDRPYRKRLSVAEACRRLRQSAGTQFDPLVVETYLDVLRATTGRAA